MRSLFLLGLFPVLCWGQLSTSGYYQNWNAIRSAADYDLMLFRNRFRSDVGYDHDRYSATVSLDVRLDRQRGESELEASMREAYIDLFFEKGDLRIGKQQVVWGKADGIFINDIVNPLDMRQFLMQDFDNIRMAQPMVKGSFYLGEWTLVGLLNPEFQPGRFAEEGNNWEFKIGLPDSIMTPMPRLNTSLPNYIHKNEEVLPEASLENAEIGLRLSTFLMGADISLLFLDGYNDIPAYRLDRVVPTLHGFVPVQLDTYMTPFYYRSTMTGLNFSRPIFSTVLKGEMGYFTDRHFGDLEAEEFFSVSDYFQGMLGIDLSGPWDSAVSFQGVHRRILDYRESMMEDEIQMMATAMVNGAFANETIGLLALCIYDVSNKAGMFRFDLDYRGIDALSISIGTYQIWGNEDSLFGQFNTNDNLFLKVKYSY
ncbi:MAG: DUF1302 family protein [Candidatus Neomarinimicrobiota bacterium]|nr:DUF1302 family protein [Candidatus Neomarinimicrobiota bacterium]